MSTNDWLTPSPHPLSRQLSFFLILKPFYILYAPFLPTKDLVENDISPDTPLPLQTWPAILKGPPLFRPKLAEKGGVLV